MSGTSRPAITDSPPSGDLLPRVIVGVILIAVAIFALTKGSYWFAALGTTAALLIFAEWAVMHRIGRMWRLAGLVMVGLACAATYVGAPSYAVAGLVGIAVLLGIAAKLSGAAHGWSLSGGMIYAGLPGIALLWLREPNGFGIVLWLLLIVWSTDILAYFAGRAIGGPKIAPRISPKKTWAGLIGGMTGAAIASGAMAYWYFQPQFEAAGGLGPAVAFRNMPLMALAGALLAIVAQAGDFYESWLKRQAGVKDSGTLLPGHGGVMDRLDGLVPVAVVVALLLAAPGWFR